MYHKKILFFALFCFFVYNKNYAFDSLQNKTSSIKKLNIQECIKTTLDHNLNIKRSKLNLQTAKINFRESYLKPLPNLNFSGSYGNNSGRSIDPYTNQYLTNSFGYSNIGLNSSLTIFNGLSLSLGIWQSQANLQANTYDLDKAKNDVIINVITAYLNVILNEQIIETSNSQKNTTSNQLQRTIKLVDAGSLPISNKLELESQLATNEVDLVNAQNNYNLSLLNLKQIMLIPSNTEIELEIPEIEIPERIDLGIPVEEIYNTALQNLPEVKSAETRIKEAKLASKIAYSSGIPSIALGFQLGTNYSQAADREQYRIGDPKEQYSTLDISLDGGNTYNTVKLKQLVSEQIQTSNNFRLSEQFEKNISTNVALQLQVPIFNRFFTHSAVQRAKVNEQLSEINATDIKNQLRQNIETAYNNALASLKTYNASLKQVTVLETAFQNVENRFNAGAVHFVDYQVVSNNLFKAKADLVRAKYSYFFRLKILDFYQGKPITE